MSNWQTRIWKDGSRTPTFRRIDVDHKLGCEFGDRDRAGDQFWVSAPPCSCGSRWFIEQEIKAHQRRLIEEQEAIDILKKLLDEDLG